MNFEHPFEELLKSLCRIAKQHEKEKRLPFETIWIESLKTYFRFTKN